MSLPPKPLKIQCHACGYKVIYNPNSDCLVMQPPNNHRCPRCLSLCEISDVKAILVGGSKWVILEKTTF